MRKLLAVFKVFYDKIIPVLGIYQKMKTNVYRKELKHKIVTMCSQEGF